MTIEIDGPRATVQGVLGIEETEVLLEWLQSHESGQLDLSACTHLHAANLQVLMAAHPAIGAWPDDPDFARWLKGALGAP